MRTSDTINELATALAKAQAEIKNAVLNKVNPHFKSRYADLASVRDAVTAPLAKNGLSIVHATGLDNNVFVVFTRMIHTSGQWIEAVYPITADTNKPQAMASAYTYAKRYSTSALTNIASEEDDDAQSAQDAGKSNGNGFPAGNPDVKYYKTAATTPGAVKAQDNNSYYKRLEREIDELKSKAEAREWRRLNEREIDERVSPEAMLHLSERYEEKVAVLP
jgi:hypothetical protein